MPSYLISMTFPNDLQFMNITKERIDIGLLEVDTQRNSKSFFVVLQGKKGLCRGKRSILLITWLLGRFPKSSGTELTVNAQKRQREGRKEGRKKDLFYRQSCHWIHTISNVLQSALSL